VELGCWEKINDYTQEEWFPSRIPFGKFKGRAFHEAAEDGELRSWLDWLAESSNQKSSRMGRWYINRLESGAAVAEAIVVEIAPEKSKKDRKPGLVLSDAESQPAVFFHIQLLSAPEKEALTLHLIVRNAIRIIGRQVQLSHIFRPSLVVLHYLQSPLNSSIDGFPEVPTRAGKC
jgi:hypothetical protein